MARTKSKKSGVGSVIYAFFLILFVVAAGYLILWFWGKLWVYATEYEGSQSKPVIEAYMDRLRENLWDDSIADFEVILAARDAQIHDDILQRPGGYQAKLIENGRDLSGGQRQRMEIARVLAQDPSVVILDEATSALDAKTEYELVKAVRDRGITCIVVAHRLSTIRDCDEIIVMEKGHIVERGTHDELYARGGIYRELVTSE